MARARIVTFGVLGAVALLAIAEPAFAQLQQGAALPGLEAGGSASGLSNASPQALIFGILRGFLAILGTLFTVLMVQGGYYFFIARGNEEYIKKGRMTLLRAGIGLLIVLISYSITVLVSRAFEEIDDSSRNQPTTPPSRNLFINN